MPLRFEVVGSHDVLGSYVAMLEEAIASANNVTATLAAHRVTAASPRPRATAPIALSTDVAVLGDLLMGNGDGGDTATLVVYNQLGHSVTEGVNVQVPVCLVAVRDDSGAVVESQTTAMFGINDGLYPFFDFHLSFIAHDIPPLGFKKFLLSPRPDADCHGGDLGAQPGRASGSEEVIPQGGASVVLRTALWGNWRGTCFVDNFPRDH